MRAISADIRFFFRRFDYVLLCFAIAIVITRTFDQLFMTLLGSPLAGYALLVFNSLFILPFMLVLQSERYIKRFAMLTG